jgi:integrase
MAQRKPRAKSPNGSGSTYFDKRTSRWVARVVVGKTEDGRMIRRTAYGKSQAEAQARLIEMQGQQAKGTAPTSRGRVPTLAVYAAEWLSSREGRRSERTIARNRTFLKPVLDDLGSVQLSKLAAEDVDRVLGRLLKSGMSPSTVAGTRAALRACLNTALKRGIVHRNVAADAEPPKVRRSEMHPLTRAQVKTLIGSAEKHRNGYLYGFLSVTGLRLGEALGLCWTDYDSETGMLRVRQQLKADLRRAAPKAERFKLEPLKTENSDRTVKLSDPARDMLDRQRARQVRERLAYGGAWGNSWDLIWTTPAGRPLDGVTVTKQWHEFTDEIGLPHCRVHDLRHTAATLLLADGVPVLEVSRLLGHAKVSITWDTYGHSTEGGRQLVADTFSKLVNGD